MNDSMLLEGMYIPLTTPFHPDGRLNLPKLASNVARYSKTPAAGLIALGPSGEPTLLSDDETREVLHTVAQSAEPEKVLVAGISRDSVHATLSLAGLAADLDYDALLIGIPSVLAAQGKDPSLTPPRELLTFFRTIADRSPLPIILLSVDGRAIPIDAAVELAAHPRIIALLDTQARESAPNESHQILRRTASIQREVTVTPVFAAVTQRMIKAAQSHAPAALISAATLTRAATAVAEPPPLPALRTRTRAVGFQIIAGSTQAMLDGLRAGASAIAPAFAACAPQACYEVFAAWKDDDQSLAEEKQARLHQAAHLAEDGVAINPGALKFACDLNGYFGGLPRLPHLPLTGEQRTELERLMKPLRN